VAEIQGRYKGDMVEMKGSYLVLRGGGGGELLLK